MSSTKRNERKKVSSMCIGKEPVCRGSSRALSLFSYEGRAHHYCDARCGLGRFKNQAVMNNAFEHQVGMKEVKAGQLLLLACPGARVYTYASVMGSDIRLVKGSEISIPPSYIKAAVEFSTIQNNLRAKHKTFGKTLLCERDWKMELWTKTVCTLQYAFWDGIVSAPIHCEGYFALTHFSGHWNGLAQKFLHSGFAAFSANTTDPPDFIQLQNPILSTIMREVTDYLNVAAWFTKWDENPEESFSKGAFMKMLQKCITRIQGNNCSRGRAIGHKATDIGRVDWGGHGMGGHKFTHPPVGECWEATIEDLERNHTLGMTQ